MNTTNRFILYGCLLLAFPLACTKKLEVTVAVPVITSVNKAAVHVGDTLVINGSMFSADASQDLVAVASVSLKVIGATPTQLTVVIPTGFQTGQLTVSLPEGQSAAYAQPIVLIVPGQPYISAITPSSAYSGDTVVVKGGNFGTPSANTAITISAVSCTVVNSTDTSLQIIVPDLAYTGPVLITAGSVTSYPFNFTVLKVDPLVDGRFYWVSPLIGEVAGIFGGLQPATVGTVITEGKDSSARSPFGTDVLTLASTVDFPDGSTGAAFTNPINSPIVQDPQGNVYYLTIVSTVDPNNPYNGPQPSGCYLAKLAVSGGVVTRSVLWTNTFDPNVATTPFFANPGGYEYDQPNTPLTNISIDGYKVYIKIGFTNTYYTADVSTSAPQFTQTTGLVDDSTSFGAQFGKNYVFYKVIGSDNNYSPDIISQVRYMARGSNVSQAIPMDPSLTVQATLADPSHGDTILIYALNESTNMTSFYKFTPGMGSPVKLYDQSNWVDAPFYSVLYTQLTTAIYWAGPHIYYTNFNRSYSYNINGGNYAYNGLYRLNDDGSSTKVSTIYPKLEPTSFTSANGYMYLFTESK